MAASASTTRLLSAVPDMLGPGRWSSTNCNLRTYVRMYGKIGTTNAWRHKEWLGNAMKERLVKNAIKKTLPADFDRLDELFDLVKARNEYR